ncbi:hypothetical protein CJ179_38550 [Rhodococcus sp. ACS1]|uniref:hypothetical protein n=1 Tax=Rhodococcus sp. ACS1 TaxID=2028570 RepID=UPI000BB0CFD7|nr:hypothetical protein [Rhodococcus sp. ACS1]PBC38501.1 hypothetical protein CJ179_38550 [Rhodococcus sp. ACS1]
MSHIDYNGMLERGEDIGGGYKKAVIVLGEGDTVDSAVSTKWAFMGPGTVEFLIHGSGIEVCPDGQVMKSYYPQYNR